MTILGMLSELRRKLTSSPDHYGASPYFRQLSPNEIASGKHRELVGGLWEEVGTLQFEFLKLQGLRPEHTLVDIGCGALRGGIHFIRYLNAGNYFGIDRNESLIEAGKMELAAVGVRDKRPTFCVGERFELGYFAMKFDYAIALSLFTHLPMNQIVRCLVETRKVLKPGGQFYATFFQAPYSAYLSSLKHHPGDVITQYDADPFHYSLDEMKALAEFSGMSVELHEAWSHPRGQKMLRFCSMVRNG